MPFAIAKAIVAFIGLQGPVAAIATFVIGSAISIGASALFAPKVKQPGRQASVITLSLAEQPREAIFGKAATGGNLLNAYNYGGTHGTDSEVLVIKLADHECTSLEGFYVDDTYVAFTGDGVVAGFSGKLKVWFLNGQEVQVLPAVAASGSGFSAGDFKGICAVFVEYIYDKKVWATGRPSFLWVVKGKKCYDPRKDSTVTGGSGSHRWATPSTWEWSENATICRYNWVRGVFACNRVTLPEMLLVGRGLSAEEAPPERVIAYANICDEDVALKAGGTEDRYRVGCVIRADEAFETIEERFAAAMAGCIVQREGGIEIEPGYAKTSLITLTDDDLDRDEPREYNPFETSARRLNSVVPRFVDPAQRYKDAAAPLRRVTADITAEGLAEEDYEVTFCTSGTQAQRCGEIHRRLSRLEKRLQLPLPARLSRFEDGDWITVNSARYTGGVAIVFRIERYAVSPDWRSQRFLREIASSVYSWTAATDEVTPGRSDLVVVPALAAVAMPATAFAAGTVTGAGVTLPTIEATWVAANVDPAIRGALMEYRVKAGPGISHYAETTDVTTGRLTASTSVPDGTLMEARISPIPDDPSRPVTWSAWSDVNTTTGTALPPGTYQPPVYDVNMVDAASFEGGSVQTWSAGTIQNA